MILTIGCFSIDLAHVCAWRNESNFVKREYKITFYTGIRELCIRMSEGQFLETIGKLERYEAMKNKKSIIRCRECCNDCVNKNL